jgi:hypothetical protein
MANPTGSTTAAVNLRSGAGTQFDRVVALPPKTAVEVLDQQGDWLHVKAAGQEGYIHKMLVQLTTQGAPDGFLKEKTAPPPAPGQPNPEPPPAGTPQHLEDVPLEAPADQRLPVNPKAPLLDRLSADIWNRFGGLLSALSKELNIDPAVSVAVMAVESGGHGFGPDGRMIIRFENQVFYDRWAKPTNNKDRYSQYFQFNADQRWTGHQWRSDPNGAWQDCHGNQINEWAIFNFACTIDDAAAKSSISMGGPQIMGFNYAALGFESVQQMFTAFSASERNQIVGFFDFVKGPTPNSRRVLAMQQQDFDTFAAMYNGPGQAAKYGGLIRGTVAAFHRLKGN